MRSTSGTGTRRALVVAALVAVVCTAAAQLASTTEIRATCLVNPYCDHTHQVHCPNGATYPSECAAQLACHYDCTSTPPEHPCDGCGG